MLAGCAGDEDQDGDDTSGGNGDGASGGNGSNELEIIHHWTRGADGKAFSAFLTQFKKEYPDVRILENTLAGQAGAGVKTVVTKRLLNNDPPSTFQGLSGKYMQPFSDHLQSIGDSVWSQNNMKDAYLEGPKKISQIDGEYMMVPLNIHRVNILFYNTTVVEEAGVDPNAISDAEALTEAFRKVNQNTDAVGFPQSTTEGWTVLQLFESILLSEGSIEAYNKFSEGNVSEVESSVKTSLERVKEYSQSFPNDANSIAWPEAASMLPSGDGAFYQSGDWAAGVLLDSEGFEFGEDWDWIPFPGTSDSFIVVMDIFEMPADNPSPEASKKFLQFCGSKKGQATLNSIKGSIPPRTDVPTDEFSGYQKDQIESIKQTSNQPGSMTHGAAVAPEALTNLKKAMGDFTANYDVDAAFGRFEQAFE
jgi:glucose/mannose transport system substrate-binding protein